MSFYRYATDNHGNVVKSNYDSDGNWVGEGPDPRVMRRLSLVDVTPVIEEIVKLAGAFTKTNVVYVSGPTISGNVHRSDANRGEILTNEHSPEKLEAFWREFDRLRIAIKRPLNEPVLDDDHSVHQGYLYVANGKVTEFIDGINMTVGRWKALRIRGVDPVTEVRRCDMPGRIARMKPKASPQSALEMELKGAAVHHSGQKHRRRRSSNKIKKVI